MAGCGPCPDSCNCQVADELGVLYPGSGDAGSPIIVPRAIPETVWVGGSLDGSIVITPGGSFGHTPDFAVNVCALLDEAAVQEFGRLMIFSNDADCKPERLRNPTLNEYLGYDSVSGEATWLPLPEGVSITIDPESTAPVSYGPNGLRVDCCPTPVPEIITYTAGGTFDKASYPGLIAVKVRAVGGGGGSGGINAGGAGTSGVTGGGGGGEYAESIIPASSLAALETITVGAGGAAGAVGGSGGTGGTSSFGAFVIANGGAFSTGNNAIAGAISEPGGTGGTGGTGDILIPGGHGGHGRSVGGMDGWIDANFGGASVLSNPRPHTGAGTSGGSGAPGLNYGGGASGAMTNGGSDRTGGAGAQGVVIVEPIYGF